jgi:hypothetical protein
MARLEDALVEHISEALIKLERRNEIRICECCGAVIPNLAGANLSPTQRKIYLFIARNPRCTMEQIVNNVYADDPNGGPRDAPGTVATLICTANKRLRNQRIICHYAGADSHYRLVKTEGTSNANLNIPPVLPGL